jgi:hypothetical protein
MRKKKCMKKVRGKGYTVKIGNQRVIFKARPKKYELLRIAKRVLRRQEGE